MTQSDLAPWRIGNQSFDISPAPLDSNFSHPRSQRPPKSAKQLENEHRLRVRIKLKDEEAQGKLGFKEERAGLNRRVKIEARKWQTKWRIAELEGNGRDALEAEQFWLETELLAKIAANDVKNERWWASGEPFLDLESDVPDYGSGTEEVARDYSFFPHKLPETAHFEREFLSSPDIAIGNPDEAVKALIREIAVNNGQAGREARRDNPLTSVEDGFDIATPRSAALITAAAALSIQHPNPALSALSPTQPPAIPLPTKRPANSLLSSHPNAPNSRLPPPPAADGPPHPLLPAHLPHRSKQKKGLHSSQQSAQMPPYPRPPSKWTFGLIHPALFEEALISMSPGA